VRYADLDAGERRGEKMVWYERYAMKFIYPSICLSVFDPDSSLDNQIEIVFDAYGDLNGINYKGQFMPIPP